MKNNVRPLHLLSFNAPENPFFLEHVYAILDQARVRLFQVCELTFHGQLLLLIVLEIPEKSGLSFLNKKLQSLDRLQFHSEMLGPELDRAVFHDYKLTLLSRFLSASLFGSLIVS